MLASGCGRVGFSSIDGAGGDGTGDAALDDGRDASGGAQMVAYIKPSNTETFDQFGYAIALSADGLTLAVGAPLEDTNANAIANAGAVYIYVRTGDAWTEQAILHPANADVDDQFGFAVALSADGNTLAASADEDSATQTINGNGNDETALNAGAVYVFVRAGTTWSEQAYIKAPNAEAADQFGAAVALSADGNVLAVGANQEDSNDVGVGGTGANDLALQSGAAYTFTRSGTVWSFDTFIKPSNTELADEFGFALALSADGSRLVISAPGEDGGSMMIGGNQADNSVASAGAVYVFVRGALWTQEAYVKPATTGFGDFFGRVLALCGDGLTLAAASPGNDLLVPNSGAVFTFSRVGTTWSSIEQLKAFNPGDNDQFGVGLACGADGGAVIAGAPFEDGDAAGLGALQDNDNRLNSGAVYAYSRAPGGSSWTTGFYAKGLQPTDDDEYGSVIASSADARTFAIGMRFEDSAANTINGDATNNFAMNSGAVEIYYFGQ